MKYKLKSKSAVLPERNIERVERQRLIASAGGSQYNNRDPVYHLWQDFQTTFDLNGKKQFNESEPNNSVIFDNGLAKSKDSPKHPEYEQYTDMQDLFEQTPDKTGNKQMYHKFSEAAFTRGKLAGAVLAGSGRLMLHSSLKRAVGSNLADAGSQRQRKLFEHGAERNINGSDKVLFNRGTANSAVAMVTNVLNSSKNIVEELHKLSAGDSVLPAGSGAETLKKSYPFLDSEQDKTQLTQLKTRLDNCENLAERGIIERAIVKTEAVINRKTSERNRFTRRIAEMSENAQNALLMLEEMKITQSQEVQTPEYTENEESPLPPPNDGIGNDGQNTE